MRGKLIVFEGLDYSFKETNTKKLYNYIKTNITDKVILLSFPNYKSESSIFIKKYLNGDYGDASKLNPYIASYFYTIDRYDTINSMNIIDKLNNGYYIICDRYIGSNVIFQSTKIKDNKEKSKFIKAILNTEYNRYKLPKEDIVIYMDMPVNISFNLIMNRKNKSDTTNDSHESNYKFMKSVEDNAYHIINKLKYNIVHCVDNKLEVRSREDIFNNIINVLKNNNII